ncbi:uncharacterized protein I303_101564 [Kwoniella dejecticola CBS 10117]|uniref:Uncharacterized protein n=1 Tax=Kwoniella dejecticola CBS 10117 TaxID=1296121 RepID=A0A1A6ADF2_9TREE|nr:uncharacterized protein I303_02304 [Kwoniella dejecticola CBS 10117]OBR88085.1 hypothetical protein I303_02304 [Kwoniella dejecticola CBS 10117]
MTFSQDTASDWSKQHIDTVVATDQKPTVFYNFPGMGQIWSFTLNGSNAAHNTLAHSFEETIKSIWTSSSQAHIKAVFAARQEQQQHQQPRREQAIKFQNAFEGIFPNDLTSSLSSVSPETGMSQAARDRIRDFERSLRLRSTNDAVPMSMLVPILIPSLEDTVRSKISDAYKADSSLRDHFDLAELNDKHHDTMAFIVDSSAEKAHTGELKNPAGKGVVVAGVENCMDYSYQTSQPSRNIKRYRVFLPLARYDDCTDIHSQAQLTGNMCRASQGAERLRRNNEEGGTRTLNWIKESDQIMQDPQTGESLGTIVRINDAEIDWIEREYPGLLKPVPGLSDDDTFT